MPVGGYAHWSGWSQNVFIATGKVGGATHEKNAKSQKTRSRRSRTVLSPIQTSFDQTFKARRGFENIGASCYAGAILQALPDCVRSFLHRGPTFSRTFFLASSTEASSQRCSPQVAVHVSIVHRAPATITARKLCQPRKAGRLLRCLPETNDAAQKAQEMYRR